MLFKSDNQANVAAIPKFIYFCTQKMYIQKKHIITVTLGNRNKQHQPTNFFAVIPRLYKYIHIYISDIPFLFFQRGMAYCTSMWYGGGGDGALCTSCTSHTRTLCCAAKPRATLNPPPQSFHFTNTRRTINKLKLTSLNRYIYIDRETENEREKKNQLDPQRANM